VEVPEVDVVERVLAEEIEEVSDGSVERITEFVSVVSSLTRLQAKQIRSLALCLCHCL